MAANLIEKLPAVLSAELAKITHHNTSPVVSLGKEKYAEDLCGK